mmetsp:Transcript_1057/g.1728  ORF Transcript_1057/g.1728 Transcript_1057/m.1728 type:complete len:248 (-) Transcript_1057:47-790(-)
MALRQRKAKDPVLPLHSVNDDGDDGDGRRSQPLMPYSSSSTRKRSTVGEPNLVYRVYIPIFGFFVVAFGFAYLTIGGHFGIVHHAHHHHDHDHQHQHQQQHELLKHRHYHDHTAGRLHADPDDTDKIGTKEPHVLTASKPIVTAEPSSSSSSLSSSSKIGSHNKNNNNKKKIKIRCHDGGGNGYLNDDYCDCEDGSDESTTSACSHLTIQQSTFHCLDGTAILYASRVNDGVKDCLDGSDEVTSSSS